ncbi:hypothetical protein OG889_15515 [Streptomyces sp. NBC_00481]|uniref:hypothetical protein n=1 Tax=unclassified Streptomyces TaxID=2593676 RepID=UPI002DDAC2A9|nr:MULTISPECIES: hypothetical protein [unclassified Streptomyces]WRY96021.1 hypothetical protein OG889_15515 [Streptomyces sp. NBC_00481]
MPVEEHGDPFEGRLGDALRRAGDAFETDGHAMVGGGAVRGRRLLLRRRAAMLGGVAGIALVGVGGALLLPGIGDGGGKQSVAAERSTEPGPRDDDGKVSGARLVRQLKDLLPAGKFSGESARGTGAEPGPYAQVVYDDGEGGAAVQIGLGQIDADSEHAKQLTDCPDKTFVEYDSCEESTLPDGSRLMLFQGYEYPDRREDTKHWYAQLVTADGYDVSVMEWNAPAQKGSPVTREDPPLTTAQLKDIAMYSGWRRAIDAIPEDKAEQEDQGEKEESSTERPEAGSVDAPVVDGATIQKTLVGLLPDGVHGVDEGSQESDFAYVVLDDGKGRSLVQINVQPGMADVADSLFGADAETLPDGTKVATRQGPGEKGGEGVVMWTVDTLRTDGLRVVISAFNSGAQHTAATRETPALTLAQLKEIATSEKWKTLG